MFLVRYEILVDVVISAVFFVLSFSFSLPMSRSFSGFQLVVFFFFFFLYMSISLFLLYAALVLPFFDFVDLLLSTQLFKISLRCPSSWLLKS